MSDIYRPLTGNEVRLLTIEPGNGDPASPLCCTLEHVSLPAISDPTSEKRFKGHDHVWPETQEVYDASTIFKKGAKCKVYRGTPLALDVTSWEANKDKDLPWRHAWGDYIALSYVWGAPEPVRSIVLNGHRFSVGPNLFEALHRLRQTERIRQGFKIWIDAICINQQDLDERSIQVGRMRDIYRSAWQVVLWTGPEADDSGLAFAALGWMSLFSRTNPSLDTFYHVQKMIDARPLFIKWETYKTPLRKEVYKALFSLLTRPYWQRMWILQEVAMARPDAPVLCGGYSMTWESLHDSVQYIARDESRLGCDILYSSLPRLIPAFSFEFGKSRLVEERQWASERMWGLLVEMMKVQSSQKKSGPRKHVIDSLRPLLLGRDAAISEEKDRVYAVLGLREIAERVTIVPDYRLSVRDIYLDFTTKVLLTGDLNILRLAQRSSGLMVPKLDLERIPPAFRHSRLTPFIFPVVISIKPSRKEVLVGNECDHGLPSWVICWTCKPAPMAQLNGLYDAGGPTTSVGIFNAEESSFTVKGYIFDTVGSLGAFHKTEVDSSYPINAFQEHHNSYGDLESIRAALWRTIVADTTAAGGERAPASYSWLLDPRIWTMGVSGIWNNEFGLENLMGRNKELVLCGHSLQEIIYGPNRRHFQYGVFDADQLYDPAKEHYEALSWAVNATAWRRLLGTENGRMGMGIAAARPGDSIAVFMGCSTPMIIREASDGWSLIGECYVDGVMYGEIPRSSSDYTDIKLY